MAVLNKFTSFMCSAFKPLIGETVYKKMRQKKIEPKELKNFTSLTSAPLDSVHLVAHRGLSAAEPENTAPSFEAAGEAGGYYGFECDTHMSKDGVWMILHDPELHTIYNGEGDVKSFTSDELMKLKVVRGANAEKYDDLKMCTLQQYIDICKKYGCRPIIEIKDPRTECMQSFYDVLVKNGIVDKVTVISFIIEDLRALHAIDRSVDMWYLVDYISKKNIAEAKESGCSGMDFSSAFNACRPDWIKSVNDNGLISACWTVDNKEELDAMLKAGVKYITTNSILAK